MAQITATEKLFGESTISETQANIAKKTYLLLFLSIFMAILGGSIGLTGMNDPTINELMISRAGFIIAFAIINIVPYVALWASKKNFGVATFFLGLDGFLSGLALSPLLFVAKVAAACGGLSQETISNCSVSSLSNGSSYILAALAITLASFVMVLLTFLRL